MKNANRPNRCPMTVSSTKPNVVCKPLAIEMTFQQGDKKNKKSSYFSKDFMLLKLYIIYKQLNKLLR